MSYEFADRLTELRRGKGLSQEDLAKELGLSRQAISKWERAESTPDIGNLVMLADVYGLTLDELVHGVSLQEEVMETDSALNDAPSDTEDISKEDVLEVDDANPSDGEQGAISSEVAAAPPVQQAESPEVTVAPPVQQATSSETVTACPPQQGAPSGATAACPPQQATSPKMTAAPPVQQAMAPDATSAHHIYQQPVKKKRNPLYTFPYPLLCVLVYLVLGFCFGLWHPMWVIFLTIPFYYWIIHIIVHDPEYQAQHGRDMQG